MLFAQKHQEGEVAGVIGIGGSGGTALITPAMRGLPVGLPKLMVSTVASGNTAPFIGCSDIVIMPSVVDVAGINAVSRRVLGNAAAAMAGMVQNQAAIIDEKPTIAMTMFGVTTPCVSAVRAQLEAHGFDCLVFHATGIGGQAMEELVQAGLIQGVLDITTTEVADRVVGGILPCARTVSRQSSTPRSRLSFHLAFSIWLTSGLSTRCRKSSGADGFMFTTHL